NISSDEILHRLTTMATAPTLVVSSGHGYHCYWRLREPEDLTTDDRQHRLKEALKLACSHIGGDPACAEVARLLPVPGSHNTKGGNNIPVGIVAYVPKRTYLLDGLEPDVPISGIRLSDWLHRHRLLPRSFPRSAQTSTAGHQWPGQTTRGHLHAIRIELSAFPRRRRRAVGQHEIQRPRRDIDTQDTT